MKTVFDNSQCAHVWAQQNQDKGRSNNGNMYFEGRTIYSYGSHFPLAIFIDSDTVLINESPYSSSTQRHQSYVRRAVDHKQRICAPCSVVKAFQWDHKFNDQAQAAMVKHAQSHARYHLDRATGKKALQYKLKDLDKAKYEVQKAVDLFDTFKVKHTKDLKALVKMVNAENAIDANKKLIEKERKAKAKREADARKMRALERAAQEQLAQDNLDAWRSYDKALDDSPNAYKIRHAIQSSSKIFMRIARLGDEIETSKGARFPIDHGKLAFNFIRKIKESDTPQAWVKNGKRIALGHFEIDEIDAQGNVKAGCHFVEWNEIERLATILEIYP
jgi:hypothetical protein